MSDTPKKPPEPRPIRVGQHETNVVRIAVNEFRRSHDHGRFVAGDIAKLIGTFDYTVLVAALDELAEASLIERREYLIDWDTGKLVTGERGRPTTVGPIVTYRATRDLTN